MSEQAVYHSKLKYVTSEMWTGTTRSWCSATYKSQWATNM